MDVLRTPDDRFANLPGFPYEPRYTEVEGLRMAYVDEGAGDPVLCLHGEPSWGFLYRKIIPTLAKAHRVVVPDLIGFGRSDKPMDRAAYTYEMHNKTMRAFIAALDLKRITLVCQDWGGLIGLPIAADMPERFARLVIMNTGLPTGERPPSKAFMAWRTAASKMTEMPSGKIVQGSTIADLPDEVVAAYDAPFPDGTYQAGALEFPLLVPISPEAPAAPAMKTAKEKLSTWKNPALVMFSDSDPITQGGDKGFRSLIPSAKNEPEITIEGAGHFLQEDKGEEIAKHIVQFIERHPLD